MRLSLRITKFDKAVLALVLPNLASAVEAVMGGLDLKHALINAAIGIVTGIGVYLKANA